MALDDFGLKLPDPTKPSPLESSADAAGEHDVDARMAEAESKEMIGVINERGALIGLFREHQYADAFVAGMHAEQMRLVGYVHEYTKVPVDFSKLPNLWEVR